MAFGMFSDFGNVAQDQESPVQQVAGRPDNSRLAFGQKVYDYFIGKGLQPHQAAAIAGNMAWEGSGRTDLINPGDNWKNSPRAPHSFGIAQWNDRLPGLIDYARSQGKEIPAGDLRDTNYIRSIAPKLDLDTQLGFVWNEMNGTEKRAYQGIANGNDLRSATAGAISYHRPAGWSWNNPTAGHGFEGRLSLAQQILKQGPGAGQPYDMYGETVRPEAPAQQPAAVAAADKPGYFGSLVAARAPRLNAAVNGPEGVTPSGIASAFAPNISNLLGIAPAEKQQQTGQPEATVAQRMVQEDMKDLQRDAPIPLAQMRPVDIKKISEMAQQANTPLGLQPGSPINGRYFGMMG